MSEIYVYSSIEDNNDYSTVGLVGALMPTECIFREVANGESMVTMKHPVDEWGRYKALQRDNILCVPVPTRLLYNISGETYEGIIYKYKVKATATKEQKTLYKKKTGNAKIKVMKSGDVVDVTSIPPQGERYKGCTRYGNGWVDPDGIELFEQIVVQTDNPYVITNSIQSWALTSQLFRIVEVSATLTEVSITARHIFYDLSYNVTSFKSAGAQSLQYACNEILAECYFVHPFTAYSNLSDSQAGMYYENVNPVSAYLEPDTGLCDRFNVGLVRDNYTIYLLRDPGFNRGVVIEYGRNLVGIDLDVNIEDTITHIMPLGKTQDDECLFLTDSRAGPDDPSTTGRYISVAQYADWAYQNYGTVVTYPTFAIPKCLALECENCTVGTDGVTKELARQRMLEQAYNYFKKEECYMPKVSAKIEFIDLGDTEAYPWLKQLNNCFLFDYITVRHTAMDIDMLVRISAIEYDCINERMKSIEIGEAWETLANSVMKIIKWSNSNK